VLADLVSLRTPDRIRHHVCCVLSELAFQDSTCCFTIVECPGLIKDLTVLLDPAAGQTQEDAARIINNLAAFCEHSIPVLVQSPGLLSALAAMALRDLDARHIAIGAINSLARCGLSRSIVASDAILRALSLALEDAGESERHAATRASAAMALANLTGDCEPIDGHRWCSSPANRYPDAVEGIVALFELSILRRQRGGILFRPYSVIYPLHQLSRYPPNRARLVALGLLPRLALFFSAEAAGGAAAAAERDAVSGRSLVLAIAIVDNLACEPALRPAVRGEAPLTCPPSPPSAPPLRPPPPRQGEGGGIERGGWVHSRNPHSPPPPTFPPPCAHHQRACEASLHGDM
jgi:hypothetical protein